MRQSPSASLGMLIAEMPKVELHLHLEGAVRPATLLALARRNQVELPVSDEGALRGLFTYQALQDFLALFMALVRVLHRGEDFEQIAFELGEDLAAQRVRYAEVMLSAAQYYQRGIDLHEVIQGTLAGFARAHQAFGTRMNLVLDYGRQCGPEAAWQLLHVARQYVPAGLVGWSIGGNEPDFPPELFAEVFSAARQAGLHTMAHAGEVSGPQSVWGAIEALHVERIGHGIRAVDDPALLAVLRERGITLDVCPTSNLYTGAVASLSQHPLRRLFDAGVPITLNTDDPTLFNTTLIHEYRVAAAAFGFTADELTALVCNGARAAFLPLEERQALEQQLRADIASLRAALGV
jgi:adenosine deaminase